MATPFPTDWNRYLETLGSPAATTESPLPDPMATFRMPTGVPLEQVAKGINFMYGLREKQQESKAAAIRYSGMNDFNRLREQYQASGIQPDEAVRRAYGETAHKIHFMDPAGFERAATRLGAYPRAGFMAKPTFREQNTARMIASELSSLRTQYKSVMAERDRLGGSLAPVEITKRALQLQQDINQLEREYEGFLAGVDERMSGAGPTVAPRFGTTPVPGLTVFQGSPPPPQGGGVRIRRLSDKKEFVYHGSPADVPTNKFEVLR